MPQAQDSIIRLALLDDHQIVIDGLKLVFKDENQFQVVLESTNSEDFLTQLKHTHVDLVITDIILPRQLSGVEISRRIKADFPAVRILALTMNEDSSVVNELLQDIKIDGFLSKAAGREELLLAIKTISNGGEYYSQQAIQMMKFFSRIESEKHRLKLSGREMEIVGCIERRLSNKQIAESLFISERTVETHRKNIYRKTGTKGEAALIEFLRGNGILGD